MKTKILALTLALSLTPVTFSKDVYTIDGSKSQSGVYIVGGNGFLPKKSRPFICTFTDVRYIKKNRYDKTEECKTALSFELKHLITSQRSIDQYHSDLLITNQSTPMPLTIIGAPMAFGDVASYLITDTTSKLAWNYIDKRCSFTITCQSMYNYSK